VRVRDVGREPAADLHAAQDHPRARRQAATDAAGQDQHAGQIAARLRQVERGVERPARALEREAVRLALAGAGADVGRAFGRLDAALVQDAAEARRDTKDRRSKRSL